MLEKMTLKILCKKLGIERMELGARDMAFTFSEKTPVSPGRITDLVQQNPTQFRITPDYVLRVRIGSSQPYGSLEASKKVLHALAS